ncbi:carbohydrate kinase [uncultured Shewanella sp.]|uniref:carbohydrate kinase family protein n=1 Tax=uncultured Shewanella sp. TaxID=173975 RepID=UPI00262ECB0D|nr:carbohydrate kinase [uncultured Shewanella sp.]
MSLLAFGEALIDFLSNGDTPETFTKYPGGAPANVTVTYAKLGGKSAFCGMFGQDMFGDYLLHALNEHKVNTDYCLQTAQAKTALAFISLDASGERRFNFYRPPAADLLFKVEHFDTNAFIQSQLFHICSNSLTEKNIYRSTLHGLTLAKTHQCLRSFDVNLRLNLWENSTLAFERISQCICHCDVLKLSQEELDFLLSHSQEQHESAFIDQCFKQGVSIIMISNGHLPVRYYTANFLGECQIPTIKVVDTTAAGDAFVGGMLYQLNQYLIKHNFKEIITDETKLHSIVQFATQCGAIACTRKGAFPSLPSFADL